VEMQAGVHEMIAVVAVDQLIDDLLSHPAIMHR